MLLVAVHASRERRYALLKERGRTDDPLSRDVFLRRDERELEIGIGNAIALADEVVSNQRSTPDRLSAELNEVVDGWVETVGG